MIARDLWTQYGIPADLSYRQVGQAVRLHVLETERGNVG